MYQNKFVFSKYNIYVILRIYDICALVFDTTRALEALKHQRQYYACESFPEPD